MRTLFRALCAFFLLTVSQITYQAARSEPAIASPQIACAAFFQSGASLSDWSQWNVNATPAGWYQIQAAISPSIAGGMSMGHYSSNVALAFLDITQLGGGVFSGGHPYNGHVWRFGFVPNGWPALNINDGQRNAALIAFYGPRSSCSAPVSRVRSCTNHGAVTNRLSYNTLLGVQGHLWRSPAEMKQTVSGSKQIATWIEWRWDGGSRSLTSNHLTQASVSYHTYLRKPAQHASPQQIQVRQRWDVWSGYSIWDTCSISL